MTTAESNRLKTVLETYGADPARWPASDFALRDYDVPALQDTIREAQEVDCVLNVASVPDGESRSLAMVLSEMRGNARGPGEVVFLSPRTNRVPPRMRWLVAAPLAASFALGILFGLTGSIDSLLPESLVAVNGNTAEDPSDFSGVTDAEVEYSEDVT